MLELSDETERRAAPRERALPEPLRALGRLAWNYWWSWAAGGTAVFRDLDPAVWEECEHNPRRLLAEVSQFRLMQMATDPDFCERVHKLAASFDEYIRDEHTWNSETEK